jgi:hypothetical protein
MNRVALSLAALAVALSPLFAHAAGGAFEINQDCIAVGCFAGDNPGFPVEITQPGSYVLTSDIGTPGNQFVDAIAVTVGGVDIDLNGHTIEGGATCTGTPVSATCTGFLGYDGITLSNGGNPGVYHVHDGRIHGFRNAAVSASDSASGSLFERLSVSENHFGFGVVGVTTPGADAGSGRIRDSEIVRNSLSGVTSSYATGRSRVFVDNSTISGNGGNGLFVGGGSVIVGSRINDNAQPGVDCTSLTCVLGQDSFQGNAGAGTQYNIGTLKDMGGNVCLDHACP